MLVVWVLIVMSGRPCWMGPGVAVYAGFCTSLDVTEDHRVDLLDFAIMQADWECGRQNIVRPKRNQIGECG